MLHSSLSLSISRALLALCCLITFPTFAQGDSSANDARASEMERASTAAMAAAQAGPRAITLGEQAVLNLPAGFAFVPRAQSEALMKAMGNHTGSNFLGMVVADNMGGFITVDFDKAGYIKDDDAKEWNADELLKNLKEGTEAGNEDRRKRGIKEFEVVGWIEKPAYDAASHRLVWSAALQDKGASAGAEQGVNYNTYVLGREGYLELNLVTDGKSVSAEKPLAHQILAAVDFNEGKRYGDFKADTDKVAEYGLAALIGGVAIKKLGLLATMGIFLAKAWKLVAVGVFAVGAAIRKLFGGKGGNGSDVA